MFMVGILVWVGGILHHGIGRQVAALESKYVSLKVIVTAACGCGSSGKGTISTLNRDLVSPSAGEACGSSASVHLKLEGRDVLTMCVVVSASSPAQLP